MSRRDNWGAAAAGLLLLLTAAVSFVLWQEADQSASRLRTQQTQTRKLQAALHQQREERPWREKGVQHYTHWQQSGFASPADPLRFDECLDRMRQRFALKLSWQFQSAYALKSDAGYRLKASPVNLEAQGATLDELLAGIRFLNRQSCALVVLRQVDLSSDAEGPRLRAQLDFLVLAQASHGP